MEGTSNAPESESKAAADRSMAASANDTRRQIGKRQAPFMFAGILAAILGCLFFSLAILCIKLLPDGHGLADKTRIFFIRGCIMMLICGLTIIWQKSTFKVERQELWVISLRSIFGFMSVYGTYLSLKFIPMGDATALVFSSPIWTSLLGYFILKERLQWIQLLALPASMLGIILIAHPALLINPNQAPDSSQEAQQERHLILNVAPKVDPECRWRGNLVALTTSLVVSCVFIILKFRKTTPIQTTTFWLCFTHASISLIILTFTGIGQAKFGLYEYAIIVFNSICSWLGQVFIQWALVYEDASILSVIRTLDVALAFTLSALFLNEEILWTSVLGAAIIALVVASIMLNSWLVKRFCSASASENQYERQQDEADAPSRGDGEGEASSSGNNEVKLQIETTQIKKQCSCSS